APGANRRLGVADIDARDADFAWADVVVCSLEVPLATARRALEVARRHGAVTILNPAPFPDSGVDFLALADYVTPNETEAARLSGLPPADLAGAAKVAAAIRARGAAHVVLTLGAAGARAEAEPPSGRRSSAIRRTSTPASSASTAASSRP